MMNKYTFPLHFIISIIYIESKRFSIKSLIFGIEFIFLSNTIRIKPFQE